MELTCNLIEAGKPTASGRIYPRETLERAIKEFNDERSIHIGTLGTSAKTIEISISKISHTIKNVWLDEYGYIHAEVKLLDTPIGKFLKELDISLLKLSPTFLARVDNYPIIDIDSIQYINITIP